ncbi:MAG: RdgB/HAM1 family non-canonical purine NTP pyrophosphatase [Butyrivibrio sp.]|nr:RdgB/HAM1 family non-canonical purine NTP pyrophosphatase [Butyrivibrio sp.]
MKIVFATGNKNKLHEIRDIMAPLGAEVISMKEAGFEGDIEENGTTFEENAAIKAGAIADWLKNTSKEYNSEDIVVLADDSGLEIDYLNKEPGIQSARYMGHDTSYDIKNNSLLERLKGVPDEKRTARFVCAIAAVFPNGETKVVRETMEGRIGYEIAGENGFGYDPIFYLPKYGKTSAEISEEEKNAISHRGKALRAMQKILAAREA